MKKLNFKKMTAVRDWQIIISLFTLGLIILSFFAWRIYLSGQIGGGYFNLDSVVSDNTLQTIDQKQLRADILLLQNRSYNQLKTIDPSL